MTMHALPSREYDVNGQTIAAIIGYDDVAKVLHVEADGGPSFDLAVRFMLPHDDAALIAAIDNDPSNTAAEVMSPGEIAIKQGSEALCLALAEKSPSGFGGADHAMYAGGLYVRVGADGSVLVEKSGNVVYSGTP